ncbi:hypothetical protein LP416_00205 [Polaromonas sp. P2-4]|nr:hypothetical protein LP416_00205 [Polaromonas sp. P2-4]
MLHDKLAKKRLAVVQISSVDFAATRRKKTRTRRAWSLSATSFSLWPSVDCSHWRNWAATVRTSTRTSPKLLQLHDFVRDVMLGHPLFMQRGVDAAVRNLDEAPNPADALKLLAITEKQLLPADLAESMKDAEFEQLRVNAVNCLAVWLAHVKGLSVAATAEALFVALWRPHASTLKHDTSKLRALTQIDELGGIGVACDEYRRQTQDKHAQADEAAREASALRERVSSVEDELSRARDVIERQEAAMRAMEEARIDALLAG